MPKLTNLLSCALLSERLLCLVGEEGEEEETVARGVSPLVRQLTSTPLHKIIIESSTNFTGGEGGGGGGGGSGQRGQPASQAAHLHPLTQNYHRITNLFC
jgi:hypothetical protein